VQLLSWILGIIDATAKQKNAEVDSNKQYVSELLAILMQRSGANQRRLAETGGIDTVLRAIAKYKNRHADRAGPCGLRAGSMSKSGSAVCHLFMISLMVLTLNTGRGGP